MVAKKEMKIYTKGGDKGETALAGGKRVVKFHPRIEAYGTVDELICVIALVKEQKIKKKQKQSLLEIQNHLMIIAAQLASDSPITLKKLPVFKIEYIKFLELQIDNMESMLVPLASFVLPGGNAASAFCQLARTVCRRAERRVCELSVEIKINEEILQYLNRLSDFLFVLARIMLKDDNIKDIIWVHE